MAVDHDVGGFEIAVQHALFVRRRQAGAEMAREFQRLGSWQPPDSMEQRREIFAVDELHRDEMSAVDFIDVEHAADIGVRHLTRRSDLGEETVERRRVSLDFARQELQRDRRPNLEVVGAVDLSHAAATEQADHSVSPTNDFAGREGQPGGCVLLARRRRKGCVIAN